jgi:hypothetical protein
VCRSIRRHQAAFRTAVTSRAGSGHPWRRLHRSARGSLLTRARGAAVRLHPRPGYRTGDRGGVRRTRRWHKGIRSRHGRTRAAVAQHYSPGTLQRWGGWLVYSRPCGLVHTPPRYSRSGGGSRSGSSSSGGNSHPEKSTSSPIPDMILEHMFDHKHFRHYSQREFQPASERTRRLQLHARWRIRQRAEVRMPAAIAL